MARFRRINGERVQFTAEEEAAKDARIAAYNAGESARCWAALRRNRDQKLRDCDWRANTDVTMNDDWKDYRQALRDLPASYDDTSVKGTITWPTEPS
tara:strand:- start:661 stop:951 length:291 start_codon:yes stop_codon:yes gene_type:complete